MVHDQADELRQLVLKRALADSTPNHAVPLVAVAGGKGGVGTTTIAANLAVALARQGRRAVLVDADLDHGGQANWCQHPERGSVLDVLAARRTVHEVLERGPSGIQILSGVWASGQQTDFPPRAYQRFVSDLKHLGPHAEVVVVDAGSSRGALARQLWQSADSQLVVTTADPAAIMECYAAIKVLQTGGNTGCVHVLVNQADASEALDVHARVAEACRKFLGLKAIAVGHIARFDSTTGKFDERSSPGPNTIVPIYSPHAEAARALNRAADTLWASWQLEMEHMGGARRARSA